MHGRARAAGLAWQTRMRVCAAGCWWTPDTYVRMRRTNCQARTACETKLLARALASSSSCICMEVTNMREREREISLPRVALCNY